MALPGLDPGGAVLRKQKFLFWIQAALHDSCRDNSPFAKFGLGLNGKDTAEMLDYDKRRRNCPMRPTRLCPLRAAPCIIDPQWPWDYALAQPNSLEQAPRLWIALIWKS